MPLYAELETSASFAYLQTILNILAEPIYILGDPSLQMGGYP